jgi:ketosteroid isomerase-like protein
VGIVRRGVVGESLWVVALLGACAGPKVATGDPQQEIQTTLERSAQDWNRGDLAAFMGDYVQDSTLTYVSKGHFKHGWQALYDHYQQDYFAPGQHRDSLTFEEIHVQPLTLDLALATARFALHRGDSVVSSGPFTLVLQRRGQRWLIIHDHTSADPRP